MKTLMFFLFIGLLPYSSAYAQDKLGEIALSEPEEKRVIVRNPDRSALIIVSEVADLEFESTRVIHGVRPRGASEWQLLLEPGRQIVTVRAPGYQPVKTEVINLQAKRAYSIKVSQVKAIPGTLLITSKPDSAEIKINGIKIEGRTPFRMDQIMPGKLNIEIEKDGYRSAMKALEVKSDQVAEWDVELTQTAVWVKIQLENDEVRDVGILINGEPKGVAPGAILLEPGTYQLVLQKPGYEFPEKVINIDFSEEDIVLSEELIPLDQPFYKKWWFYAGSAALVTGAAIILGGTDNPGQEPLSATPPSFP